MKYAHPLWRTLRSLKGNQRAAVVVEPLWSVPNNLFMPFVSVYMVAIGLHGEQIGTTVSVGLAMQLVWALLSGAIADKYGRRKTMLVFGLLSWTIPCMLWAIAHGYLYFMLAVVFNSMWQVTGNCFGCIIVEDGDMDILVNIWTLINLTGLVAGFISPITGIFIDRFTLTPTLRAIYIFSMVMMTLRFILQYYMSYESSTGKRRIKECAGQTVLTLTFRGWSVFVSELRQPRLLLCVMLMALLSSFSTVQTTFWSLFVTKVYHVSNSMLSVFPLVASLTTLVVYMLVIPRINIRSVRFPLFAGLGLHSIGIVVLLVGEPLRIYLLWIVFLSAICEAFSLAILGPLTESIMSVVIPSEERASVNSFITAFILLIGTPVGWIAGSLFQTNYTLPMVLNLCLIVVSAILSLFVVRVINPKVDSHA
ncbi:MFS transporter [Alicyclobacillus fastidiosus]|uniref:MFS transporter n=1 Tax=Alicyclobacillus fastidiosus TaxID=392011 RepID=A0ABV5ALS0_9BACL|nr:MFS transporter [Alicyclobacillus fastidiosus]WEH08431.1 MFS transporter [Alicyclobacillus fastidiosus]